MRSGTAFLGSLCRKKNVLSVWIQFHGHMFQNTVPWTLQSVVFPRSNQPQCRSLPVLCAGKEGLVTFVAHVLVLCRNAKPIVTCNTVYWETVRLLQPWRTLKDCRTSSTAKSAHTALNPTRNVNKSHQTLFPRMWCWKWSVLGLVGSGKKTTECCQYQWDWRMSIVIVIHEQEQEQPFKQNVHHKHKQTHPLLADHWRPSTSVQLCFLLSSS